MPHGRPHTNDIGSQLSSIIFEQGNRPQGLASPVNAAGGLNIPYAALPRDRTQLGNQNLQIGLQQPQAQNATKLPQGLTPVKSVLELNQAMDRINAKQAEAYRLSFDPNSSFDIGDANTLAKQTQSHVQKLAEEFAERRKQGINGLGQGQALGGGMSFTDEAKQRQVAAGQQQGIDWMALSNVFAHIGAGFEGPGQELGRSMVQLTNRQLTDRRNQGILDREELNVARGLDMQRGRDISIAEGREDTNLRLKGQARLNVAESLDRQAQLERDRPLAEGKIQADIAESKARTEYYNSIRPGIEKSKVARSIQGKEQKSIVDANVQGRRAAEEQRRLERDVRGSIDIYDREPLDIDTEIRNYEETRIRETVKAGELRELTASEVLNTEDYARWQRMQEGLPRQQRTQPRATGEIPRYDQFLD